MDISQVYMVRSAKGNDMLCVDSFLYYYDDRGLISYRWSCSKRKDKVSPCKSRIITKLIENDETKHAVVKVFGEHSHGQCSPEEISKAFERKRIANLERKPCTLEAKAEKRKLMKTNVEEFSQSFDGTAKKTKRSKVELDDETRVLTSSCKQDSSDVSFGDNKDDKIAATTLEASDVYMLKTTHGREMICVEGYLYRLEGKTLTSSTYRWECTRRRDDGCKARMQTLRMRDGRHAVKQRRFNHTHPPQYARDKLAELINKQKLNTSLNKSTENNKTDTEDFEEINLANSSKLLQEIISPGIQNTGKNITKDDIPDIETTIDDEHHTDDDDDGDNENNLVEPKSKQQHNSEDGGGTKTKGPKFELDVETGILTSSFKQENSDASFGDDNSDKIAATTLEASNVYMLKTTHGREMVCVDGYLYRLEGKTLTSNTYRWECSRRRDDGCKARIQTLRLRTGRHAVKQRRFNHTHPPYARDKLAKLFNKQQINISTNKSFENNKTATEEFEEINLANSSKLLQEMMSPGIQNTDKNISKDDIPDIETTIDDDNHDDADDGDDNEENLLEPISKQNNSDDEEGKVDPLEGSAGTIQTDLDLTQIRLLPSSKGNKMLCIDNFLYHFDSRSTNKQRIYWTCVHRRDKFYNCRARITSDNNVNSSIKIMKVSGQHMHPNDIDKIKQRLCNDFVVKAANTSNMKPKEFLNSSMKELSDSVRDIVVNSKDTIRRKISRLRYKIKQKDINAVVQRKFKKPNNDDDDSDSMSSLSSSFHSDDDNFPALPMNLDEMKTKKEDSMVKTADGYFDITYFPEVKLENKKIKLNKAECREKRNYEESSEEQLADVSMDQVENEFCEDLVSDMDLTKISTLRSAKGGELLCIDDFLYHVKSARDVRTYWECIKSKNKIIKCRSRVTTSMTTHGYVVKKVTNTHSHEASRAEVEKRLMRNSRKSLNRQNTPTLAISDFFDCDQPHVLKAEKDTNELNATTAHIKMRKNSAETRSVMKLYSVSDGPPSLAVQMTLKAIKIPFELVNIDYCMGEHMTEEYAKMNPQKEIPVLDDDGFYLSESVAIMQYLCDKYAPHSLLYPKEAAKRAIVNHRLCFNMGFYYSCISAHAMAPIFFDYPRNEMSLMKVNNALAVFEKYLQRSETKYAAGNNLTIADFPLVTATLCLEAIGFNLSPYPLVKKWYENFKEEYPDLWEIGNVGMKEIEKFEKNPPDLSNLNHPFHPARKIKQ